MRGRLWWAALMAIAAISMVRCGGECRVLLTGGLVVGCGDEPPGPGDPAFGTAAEVLLKDCNTNQLLWVGIDAPPTPTPTPGGSGGRAAQGEDVFAEFESLRCAGKLNWIGGTVVVANDRPNGFFFDPAEILVLEDAPLRIQTSIAAIAMDPGFYAPDGGRDRMQWVVPAEVLDIETTNPVACPIAPTCTASSL